VTVFFLYVFESGQMSTVRSLRDIVKLMF